jgi:hypothetical protein
VEGSSLQSGWRGEENEKRGEEVLSIVSHISFAHVPVLVCCNQLFPCASTLPLLRLR